MTARNPDDDTRNEREPFSEPTAQLRRYLEILSKHTGVGRKDASAGPTPVERRDAIERAFATMQLHAPVTPRDPDVEAAAKGLTAGLTRTERRAAIERAFAKYRVHAPLTPHETEESS